MTTEHCSEVFQLDEGDSATLVLDDESTVDVKLDGKNSHHDESGPHITEQRTLTFTRESDGVELYMARTDGLSGLPDADPFPSFFPLYEAGVTDPGKIPDEHVLGYVEDVQQQP